MAKPIPERLIKSLRFLDEIESYAGPHGITINRYMLDNDGQYWTVAGAGVSAGGYATLDLAIKAWLDARQYIKGEDGN